MNSKPSMPTAAPWTVTDSNGKNPVTFNADPKCWGTLLQIKGGTGTHGWLVLGATQWAYYPSNTGQFSHGTISGNTLTPDSGNIQIGSEKFNSVTVTPLPPSGTTITITGSSINGGAGGDDTYTASPTP